MIGLAGTLIAGCDAPDMRPSRTEDRTAIARGRAAAERLGCGACHSLPGVDWPKGRVGPPLEGFASQAMIAGRLPNRPDILARFVRDAPSIVPGTAMPAIPMREADARDVAAWLLEDR
jgi:cytochrome c2